MSTSVGTVRRPGIVTFIGVIVAVQGFLAAVAGIVVIAFRNSDSIRETTSQTASALMAAGIAELVVAGLYLLVGFGILGGNRMARFLVVLVQGIGMALATWLLLTHHGGGYTTRSLVALLIGTFVIWALYGHPESDEWFSAEGPATI
jgi:hypothetical protein